MEFINGMWGWLDINNVMFTVWDYPMSYVEFFGTVLNIWCVYLASRAKLLNWPVGIAASLLYVVLFYQIRLYSDMGEQIYFILIGFYGWWMWRRLGGRGAQAPRIGRNGNIDNLVYMVAIAAGTVLLMRFMQNIHLYLPALFSEPASYPFWDAFTTVMSFAATILMARGKVECWYLWILVDVIGVWLYFTKGVRFIALEYVIFLALATRGLFDWRRKLRPNKPNL